MKIIYRVKKYGKFIEDSITPPNEGESLLEATRRQINRNTLEVKVGKLRKK